MGDTLSPQVIAAFSAEVEAELQKQAGINRLKALYTALRGAKIPKLKTPAFWKAETEGMREGVGRLMHPIQGMKKGLRDMTPAKAMKDMTPGQRAEYLKPGWVFKPGKHLAGEEGLRQTALRDIARGGGTTGSKARGVAEELSRRGWTGKGNITKYMPVGAKSGIAAWPALSAPSIIDAAKRDPSAVGEGGAAELGLGELGGLGGMILGTGLKGFVPGMAVWGAGQYAGSKLGRIIDRLRGGADLPTAAAAPSPREVAEQLGTIQRYYG